MSDRPLFATIEVGRDVGWTKQIVARLPKPGERYELGHAQDLFGLTDFDEVVGIVLIGTQSWDGFSQDQADTVQLLTALCELNYAGTVVYLTDLHATDDAKAPFLRAFPGLHVLSKTAVANGSQPLPFD